ncbi:hypothetical protein FHX74_001254 [Friedmanniella endophytica]|uniref:TY-Chap N-terminal domain-containing protein n=1 Tax=Microlunatus kandeliicorticis TaxID=1759536 RepID=A0A7W3P568_9ACTN|nr:hypothetical protein [Microlunatus kandeliicorticis]MBA8793649.1 hypothetical protein [Microlunatus kandeliicorticis]
MDEYWSDFAGRLARTLGELAERSVLTIAWASVPTIYLQFAQDEEGLTVRTGAEDVAGSAQLGELSALGWESPETDPLGRRTWHTALGWPARSGDYDRLAQLCVRTLTDAHGVPSPDELEYRAHREGEEPPEDVVLYEEDLEQAEPHLVLDRLGITDANG